MITTFLFPLPHPGTENPKRYNSINAINTVMATRFAKPPLRRLGAVNGGVMYPLAPHFFSFEKYRIRLVSRAMELTGIGDHFPLTLRIPLPSRAKSRNQRK
jgi:hypothetical protein